MTSGFQNTDQDKLRSIHIKKVTTTAAAAAGGDGDGGPAGPAGASASPGKSPQINSNHYFCYLIACEYMSELIDG